MKTTLPLSGAPAWLLRRRHPILWLSTAVAVGMNALVQGGDWFYFVYGSDLLVGRHPQGMRAPGGLHLFANYHELHMGPFSLLVAGAFRVLSPGDGRLLAMAVLCALGPACVYLVERAAVTSRGLRDAFDQPLLPLATLVSGLVFCLAWVEVAGPAAHLDDVLVLAAAAVVVWAVATGRPLVAGAAVGLGVGSKSWAVLLFPLLACLPWRRALRGAAVGAVLAAAAWLPFVLADRGTIRALNVNLHNDPASGLNALGIHAAMTPGWDRPVQIGLALTLAFVAVTRGRWAAALLLAVGARLALDPAVFSYYMPGLVLGGLVWDLVGARRPLPIWAPAAFVALQVVPHVVADPHVAGLARIGVAVAACATLLARRRAPRLRPVTSPAG